MLVSQTVIYRPDLTVAVIGNAGAALCILFTGIYRHYSGPEEKKPESYGFFAYGMAGFSLLVTILFLAGVYILWQ